MSATYAATRRTRVALIPFAALLIPSAPLLLAESAAGTATASQKLTLKGTITRADGTPLPGAAAYIYTALVRRGTSPY